MTNQINNKSYLKGEVCYSTRRTTKAGEVINCKIKAINTRTGRDGQAYESTYYGRVVIWEGADRPLDGVEDGAIVEVSGELRNNKYTGADGIERNYTELVAHRLHLLQAAPLPEIKPDTAPAPEIAGEDIPF